MLLAQSLGGHNLLLRLVFGTKQSARQTTPRLFKNPRLTSRGYLPLRSRSFSYEIPPDTPNRHLYWNNTEMNRLLRRRYNANRLYKLGIRPIHRDGVRIYERTLS